MAAIEREMNSLVNVNNCLKEGKFQDTWKNAEIVILLKAKGKDPLAEELLAGQFSPGPW